MLVLLLNAVILFFSIQILQRDRDATDFGTAFIIVFVPAIILFLSNLAIGIFALSPMLIFVSIAAAVFSV